MKKYFILAAAAIMISACSFDHELEYDGSGTTTTPDGPIPLAIGTSSVVTPSNVSTRSTSQLLQKDTISKQAKLGLFILKDGNTKLEMTTDATPVQINNYEFFNLETIVSGYNTANDNSDLQASDNTNNVLVYPSDKSQGINLYAYAPYNDSPGITDIDASSTSTNKISVSVQNDQTTNLNYIKSDIIWGCVGQNAKGKATDGSESYPSGFTGAPGATINGSNYISAKTTSVAGFVCGTTAAPLTNPKVIIPMLHRAAKVIVKLKVSNMPLEKLEGAKVSVFTRSLTSNLRIDTGVLDALTSGDPTNQIVMTSSLGYKIDDSVLSSASGYYTKLTASDATTANDGANGVIIDNTTDNNLTHYVCSAIVMPQSLVEDAKLFQIELADGTSSTVPTAPVYSTKYVYKNPSTLTVTSFDSGKQYIYEITVTASGLQVTTTVDDWATTSDTTGSADLTD